MPTDFNWLSIDILEKSNPHRAKTKKLAETRELRNHSEKVGIKSAHRTKENKYPGYPQTKKVYDFICKNCRVISIATLRALLHFFGANAPRNGGAVTRCTEFKERLKEKCTETAVQLFHRFENI